MDVTFGAVGDHPAEWAIQRAACFLVDQITSQADGGPVMVEQRAFQGGLCLAHLALDSELVAPKRKQVDVWA